MTTAQTFAPPALNPLQARFLNALCTRIPLAAFKLHGADCVVAPDPWQTVFTPVCGLTVDVDGAAWRLEFASSGVLCLHQAGALAADAASLPQELRLALLELALQPLFAALADFLGLPAPLALRPEEAPAEAAFACAVPLLLHLPEESVAVRVLSPGREAAGAVLERLQGLPLAHRPVGSLLLPVSLEAGHARLSRQELHSLELEDIILPVAYPALQGEACLRVSPDRGIRCALQNNLATVLDFALTPPLEDEAMNDTQPDAAVAEATAQEATAQEAPAQENAAPATAALAEQLNLDSLEVTLTFELERRLMSIAEIGALTPGYTFPLAVDPAAPVTLRVSGQTIGSGRLVDLNGTLGVQVTAINTGK